MSRVSYEEYESRRQAATAQSQKPRIGYFGLKNDKDEAIVRFMHDSTADFDINYVHTVLIDGKYRKINCLRELHQSVESCPLCAAGNPLQKKIYIHLIEYTKGEDGTIKPVAKMWERPSSYITTLKNLCDEYQPLSDYIFKIKRNGAAGSVDTTYDIMYANPNVYTNEAYPKDADLFTDVKAIGTTVFDKTFDEVAALAGASQPKAVEPAAPVESAASSTRTYQPISDTDDAVDRPKRLYNSEF